jgi:hypothetical protein
VPKSGNERGPENSDSTVLNASAISVQLKCPFIPARTFIPVLLCHATNDGGAVMELVVVVTLVLEMVVMVVVMVVVLLLLETSHKSPVNPTLQVHLKHSSPQSAHPTE